MTMKVIPLEFGGPCTACNTRSIERTKGGIEIGIGEFSEEMICLGCARRLAARLLKAIANCVKFRAQKLIYRNDRWMTKEAHEKWLARRARIRAQESTP